MLATTVTYLRYEATSHNKDDAITFCTETLPVSARDSRNSIVTNVTKPLNPIMVPI